MKKVLFTVILTLSLLMNIAVAYVVLAKNPMKLQGQQSWIDLHSDNSDATIKFLQDNLGIKVIGTSNNEGIDYRVIKSKDGMFPFAGIMQINKEHRKNGLLPHATIYLTVKDYDAMHKQFIANGAKTILANKVIENMKFGIYIIPGGIDIGIVEYSAKK